ncbi:ATP-binding region, ATPase-like:Histidine kinase A, N-terminal [Sterolibacterium denitrificans]|uniref:histidine kinase n=2 Tax=Sterolibacterium denitrificans TaxID=157592 RepID=A0A7Z7HRD5_9PROT|nr:ATP-binding region, ATPase-like:Histidine kinase A, N-terminal [Sterolibacterium denitrificans]
MIAANNFPSVPMQPSPPPPLVSGHDDLRRLQWLRDFAIAMLALVVIIARPLFHTLVPWLPAFSLLGLWTLISIATWIRLRRPSAVDQRELLLHIGIDLAMLTALLAVSGGPANPLTALYLPPIAIAAAVLPAPHAWFIALLGVAAYSLLWKFSLSLTVEDVDRAMQMHLTGMWLTFAISALLIAGFIGRITIALRRRERQLAAAREQALRDERIVALGNLAAGAAHELGTPLATMAVITGELAHDPALPGELQTDIQLLKQQIGACKNIISSLAERAGVQRAEGGKALAADQWLAQLVARWRTMRPQVAPRLQLSAAAGSTAAAPRIFIETTLEQALLNLFNNAADASPEDVAILAQWDSLRLRIDILDRGPGMDSALLAQAGREFFSTRSEGTGIGLFLAHAALDRHGGSIRMTPRADGGTLTRVELPLQAMLAQGGNGE